MSIGSTLAKGVSRAVSSACKYVKYGKQVGNTAKNGAKVFKKGSTTTGLDKDGNVIKTITKTQTGPNTTRTTSVKNLGTNNFGDKLTEEVTVIRSDNLNGGDIFLTRKFYQNINGTKCESLPKSGTKQFINVTYDKVNGKKVFNSGCADSPYLDTNNHLWNSRVDIKAKNSK